MSRTWLVVTLVGAGTIAIKSIGPVLLGVVRSPTVSRA
jgi:hypothetical protein